MLSPRPPRCSRLRTPCSAGILWRPTAPFLFLLAAYSLSFVELADGAVPQRFSRRCGQLAESGGRQPQRPQTPCRAGEPATQACCRRPAARYWRACRCTGNEADRRRSLVGRGEPAPRKYIYQNTYCHSTCCPDGPARRLFRHLAGSTFGTVIARMRRAPTAGPIPTPWPA
jgi:hypothetical protein